MRQVFTLAWQPRFRLAIAPIGHPDSGQMSGRGGRPPCRRPDRDRDGRVSTWFNGAQYEAEFESRYLTVAVSRF